MSEPSIEQVAAAAAALRAGGLVILPTETVYGLGADARNPEAVAAIFAAKGRPRFNPLIVHVPDQTRAEKLAVFTPLARRLAASFWPGPLTLVLQRRDDSGLCDLVSAGLDTVALRLPRHNTARALLQTARCPVAAPSANRSGRISPTTAEAARDDLGEKVSAILDAGPCRIGLESAVVDARGEAPVLLREGGATAERIAEVAGLPVERADAGADKASPGMLEAHYAPSVPLVLEPPGTPPHAGDALLTFGPADPAYEATARAVETLSETHDLTEAAARLYSALRRLDAAAPRRIMAHAVPEEGLGRAINDRLRRAASGSARR